MKFPIKSIKDFKEGEVFKGFFLCKYKYNKITRLGDQYLDLLLEDNSGTIRGKLWNFVDVFNERIVEGNPVAIKGKIILFNNQLEINIISINTIINNMYNDYGYNKKKIIKTIKEDSEKIYKNILNIINSLNKEYKILLKNIFKDNEYKIKNIPSNNNVYFLNGGYLKQINNLLNINEKLFSLYDDLDYDIVVSGIIVKNIGLLKYYNNDLQFTISNKNESLGYKLLGINLISEYFYKSNDISEDIKNKIQSIILSENDYYDINLKYINSIYQFEDSFSKNNIE